MRKLMILGFVAGLLAGCAGGKAFDYVPPDELPAGPGLFSGEDGHFSVFVPYPEWD
jgi:hypothetical protein